MRVLISSKRQISLNQGGGQSPAAAGLERNHYDGNDDEEDGGDHGHVIHDAGRDDDGGVDVVRMLQECRLRFKTRSMGLGATSSGINFEKRR